MPLLLEDVFKQSGFPEHTFVEPVEYTRLLVALRTPGRGVVLEGPSGVGKTTAVTKALKDLEIEGQSALRLSARKLGDRQLISELPNMSANGAVIIDDFHRLDDSTKAAIADYMKILADEEDATTKIIVIGINRAGETLMDFAADLRGRVDVIRFEKNPEDRVIMLVTEGATALNVVLPAEKIAKAATGSFHLAQLLCHTACLMAEITEQQEVLTPVDIRTDSVIERVKDDQAMSFMDTALKFAAGPRFSKEGRAPYLHMLKWLGESDEWTISLQREARRHPAEEASVSAVLSGGHLVEFIARNDDVKELIHFDPRTKVLAVEDPKFYFFIRNLEWGKFSERVGFLNIGYKSRYDFALSFAGPERAFAEALHDELSALEFAVFYDKNEQARILATDVEEYLAPIYSSEATFVVVILGDQYPERVWTRFESKQFKMRFGSESVIPAWFAGSAPSLFDRMRQIGSFVIDSDVLVEFEAKRFAALLAGKVSEYRLGPRVPAGEFLCKKCFLIFPFEERATTQTSLCINCAEKEFAALVSVE